MEEGAGILAGVGLDGGPTKVYIWEEAINVGKRLERLGSIGEYISFLGNFGGKFVEKEANKIEDEVGVDVLFGWFHDAGKELVQCGKRAFVCRFTFHQFEIPGPSRENFP